MEGAPRMPAALGEDRLAYTLAQTATMLGVSRDSVRRAIARGELRTFQLGPRPLVTAESLRALIARGMEPDGDKE